MADFLKESFGIVTKVVNSVKSSATSCRFFAEHCGRNEAKHDKLLFFTAVRWLSKGNSFPGVFELREELKGCLSQKKSDLVEHLKSDGPVVQQSVCPLFVICSLH